MMKLKQLIKCIEIGQHKRITIMAGSIFNRKKDFDEVFAGQVFECFPRDILKKYGNYKVSRVRAVEEDELLIEITKRRINAFRYHDMFNIRPQKKGEEI